MSSKEQIKALRENREAKAQARILKLRELNFQKYGKPEFHKLKSASDSSVLLKNLKPKTQKISNLINTVATVSTVLQKDDKAPNAIPTKIQPHIKNTVNNLKKKEPIPIQKHNKVDLIKSEIRNNITNKDKKDVNKCIKNNRKSFIPTVNTKLKVTSKSTVKFSDGRQESVFERLYKPKSVYTVDNSKHNKKPITSKTQNKRYTTFEHTKQPELPIRRSISAVHFKKIDKNELNNCIHKWASIGEKINKISLENVDEDENIKVIGSAVKCEHKKVTFQTPLINPDEMRSRLEKWLKKHEKSIDTYKHLNCFGIQRSFDLPKLDCDDENKENEPLESDSDNESFTELTGHSLNRWRSPSSMDSMEYNESYEKTPISEQSVKVNDALMGALNDLTDLLKNGYSWEEGARWLRAIRDKYSYAQDTAVYWECRAALEEARGDMPASVQCWEEALAKGTEESVAEANIDQLLVKFLQLKIDPSSEKKREPKLIDAKNVFKSTLLRFALQEAKKHSNTSTLTPVRRSARLSHRPSTMKLFNSVQKALDIEKANFKPNKAIGSTP